MLQHNIGLHRDNIFKKLWINYEWTPQNCLDSVEKSIDIFTFYLAMHRGNISWGTAFNIQAKLLTDI